MVIAGLGTLNNYFSNTDIPLGTLSVGAHTYTLTSVTDACLKIISPGVSHTININPIPDITGTTPATQTICSGNSANIALNSTVSNTIFAYTVSSSPSSGFTWASAPSAGSITDSNGDKTETLTQLLNHNYNSAVTVTYTITPTGPGTTACPGTPVTRTVIVSPVPAIANKTATICSGTAFSIAPVNGTDVVPAGTTYTWTAPVIAPAGSITGGSAQGTGQSAISQTLTNTTNASATATYTVTPRSGSCNGATFTVQVTVSPRATIANKTATICSGRHSV